MYLNIMIKNIFLFVKISGKSGGKGRAAEIRRQQAHEIRRQQVREIRWLQADTAGFNQSRRREWAQQTRRGRRVYDSFQCHSISMSKYVILVMDDLYPQLIDLKLSHIVNLSLISYDNLEKKVPQISLWSWQKRRQTRKLNWTSNQGQSHSQETYFVILKRLKIQQLHIN